MTECIICFDLMDLERDRLMKCKYCRCCTHYKCFLRWVDKNPKNSPDKCLYCQCDGGLKPANMPWGWRVCNCWRRTCDYLTA